MSAPPAPLPRVAFLRMAVGFEGALAVLALLLAGPMGVSPTDLLVFDWRAVLFGLAAALPPFALLRLSEKVDFAAFRSLDEQLERAVGPAVRDTSWGELASLSLYVGLCEELLFRGVLRPWFEGRGGAVFGDLGDDAGWWTGWVATNLLFGAVHALSLTYFLFAVAMGLYLGWLLDATGERNLLVPILAHAAYDFLALAAFAEDAA